MTDFSKWTSEHFNTYLAPDKEAAYKKWSKDQGRERDTHDYDLRGYYQENGPVDLGKAHLTDKFKKPNHPAFSNESQYNSLATPGGQWQELPGADHWGYLPATNNPYTQEYFKSGNEEAELLKR